MESKTYYLRLKVLSPTHVGCDEVYEPTGFTVDEKKQELIAFEPADFLGQLEQSKLDEYSAICKKGSVESLLDIYKFNRRNKEHAKGRRVSISHTFVQHYNKTMNLSGGNIQNQLNNFQIGRTAFQRLNGMPYLPGSAIKGAIRTAVLSYRTIGKPKLRVRSGAELNETLAGGKFDTDPFRLIKVGDFQAVKNISQRIAYGINRKKRPAKKEAQGPYQMLEVVEEGTEFVGTVTIMVPDPGAKIPQQNQITFEDIKNALNSFYKTEQKKEQLCLQGINCDANVLVGVQQGASLLRVGRHSGAECVTVAGYRKIWIKKGSRDGENKSHSTTIWLVSESNTPNTNKSLKPFGWVALSEMTDGEIIAFEKEKKENFAKWETKQQQSIIDFHEKAKDLIRLREAEELAQKKAAEEQRAREEEFLSYPWRREILPKLDTVQDWGALKTTVLEAADFKQYQSEKEVGEAVGNAAKRVAEANRKKWDDSRDQLLADWLLPSQTKWQNMAKTKGVSEDAPAMSQEEASLAAQIESLNDWGSYKASGIGMGELTLVTSKILAGRFKKDWGCTNKKAKKDKTKAWKELQQRLKQLRDA